MRVILLARVSTEEQFTTQQVGKLEDVIKSHPDWVLEKDDFYEFDESAHIDIGQRKKFGKLLEKLQNSKEKAILLTDKVDRLSRDFIHFVPVIDNLRKKGDVELHFPGDNLVLHKDSNANDLFRFNMYVTLAQHYSDSISDNVKRKFIQIRKEGRITGKAPFGYKNIGEEKNNKSIEVDPFEASIVLKIFQWYATSNYSYMQIKEKVWDEFKVKLGAMETEGVASVGNILKNKFYIGIATYKKTSEEYVHKYPRIIPLYLFNKIQEIIENRNKRKGNGKNIGRNFKYRNMITCAICGHSVTGEQHRGKVYYRCTQYGGKHDAKYIEESKLDEQFRKAFKDLQLSEKISAKVLDDLKKTNDTNYYIAEELIKRANEERNMYRKMKSKLYDDYASGKLGITDDFYEEKSKQYDLKIHESDENIAQAQKVENSFYVTARHIVLLTKHSLDLFESSKVEEKGLLIKTALLNIKLEGEKLSWDYNPPFNIIVKMNDYTSMGGRWDLNP